MPDDRISPREPGALLSVLMGDITDLLQKEIALAKGELQQNISDKIMGSVWLVISGVVFFIAALTLVAGLVMLVIEWGLEGYWAAFAVGGAIAVIGIIMLMVARSKMSGDTLPTRSMQNVSEDIKTVKEQIQ